MLEFLGSLFGSRNRLPRDRVTRMPRAVRKRGKTAIEGMQAAIDQLAALPGLADVARTKKLPRGFTDALGRFRDHYDAYLVLADEVMGTSGSPRPGQPGGCGACRSAPFPVQGVESLAIYRQIRTWRDFRDVAERLASLAELQFKDIQKHHSGKDPEKIRLGGGASKKGRQTFAARGEPCPFLDLEHERCRIWEQRPMNCRMHRIRGDSELADPRHADHARLEVVNLRVPIRQQLALAQIDRRMGLGLSPFVYAAILQLLQLGEGEPLIEAGEAPQRMQQDGSVQPRANRNVPHAKKFQKKKKRR